MRIKWIDVNFRRNYFSVAVRRMRVHLRHADLLNSSVQFTVKSLHSSFDTRTVRLCSEHRRQQLVAAAGVPWTCDRTLGRHVDSKSRGVCAEDIA